MDENSLEAFLSTVYGKCIELGVNPDYIAKYIQELTALLEDKKNDEAVSIQGLNAFFEERRKVKTNLEEEIAGLQSKAQKLLVETSFSERNLEELVQQKTRLEADLSWNINLRDELKKQGLNVDSLSRVLDAARFFSDNKLSVEELLIRFSSAKSMENAIQGQEQQLDSLNQKNRSLKEETRVQDELLAERKLKNSELDQLKEMGFGLWDLKLLRNLVTELAIENGQATENGVAVKEFISDIESHYPDYLRLRYRVSQLKANEANSRAIIGEIGQLGTAVKSFLNRNPAQNDIREVTEFLEGYPKTSSPDPSKKNRDHSESRMKVTGSSTARSDDIDREKVSVPSHLEVKEDYPQENSPTFFNGLRHEYLLSPCSLENIDTSTKTSTRPSNSQETYSEKKNVGRIRTPLDLPRLPDPREDDKNGSTN